jgi:hypothetical protein
MTDLAVYMPHSGTYHLVAPEAASKVRGVVATDTARCGSVLNGGVILTSIPSVYRLCSVCAGAR